MLANLLRRAFFLEQWKVGWSKRTIGEFLNAPDAAENYWIEPADKLSFLADPFGLEEAGGLRIFAESLVHGGPEGEIVSISAADPSACAPAIRKPWHLSYPFVVSDAGERFLVPEQAETDCIAFYRINEELQVSEDPAWMLEGLPSLDPTFLYHQGRWWLFSLSSKDELQNTYLYLHYADCLRGPYTAHPANPVVSSIGSARPAGRVVELNERLFRPAQDCSAGYGTRIAVAEIVEISTTSYSERHHTMIGPSDLRGAFREGVHHLDHTAHYVLFDSKRFVFQWNAWWLKLRERAAHKARVER